VKYLANKSDSDRHRDRYGRFAKKEKLGEKSNPASKDFKFTFNNDKLLYKFQLTTKVKVVNGGEFYITVSSNRKYLNNTETERVTSAIEKHKTAQYGKFVAEYIQIVETYNNLTGERNYQ
jgi:hypothetical protein